MARAETSEDHSSKRHQSLHWSRNVGSDKNDGVSSQNHPLPKPAPKHSHSSSSATVTPKKKLQSVVVSRLRSFIFSLARTRPGSHSGLRSRVVGTLFGSRRGHVHFAIQKDPNSPPAFLVEFTTPISGLVKYMASGLVRIALECDGPKEDGRGGEKTRIPSRRLMEEPVWRTYCNGKNCGYATRREGSEKETKILKTLEKVSMGAGVLPETEDSGTGGVMYMRAKFERIVGSQDSEAFYMMNLDSNGAPELSVYLLRV